MTLPLKNVSLAEWLNSDKESENGVASEFGI